MLNWLVAEFDLNKSLKVIKVKIVWAKENKLTVIE